MNVKITVRRDNRLRLPLSAWEPYEKTIKILPIMRTVFGIFMIIFYVGIGILILLGVLNFYGDWEWLRWVAGSLLVVYGLWRGYRQFAGLDNPDR